LSEFGTVFWTAAITLCGAWFTYWLTGKPRLIVFSPTSTAFQLQSQAGAPPISVRAGQVVIQNNGRVSATDVQIVAEPGPLPSGYNIIPPIDHSVRTGSRGEWILELGFLGPGENVSVQILNGPQIASVRAREGPAKPVPVVHQRVFPRWVNATVLALTTIGVITVGYALFVLLRLLLTLTTV
jgi:hypothetical protein